MLPKGKGENLMFPEHISCAVIDRNLLGNALTLVEVPCTRVYVKLCRAAALTPSCLPVSPYFLL